MKKCKILFLAPTGSTCCLKDELILRKHYEVKTVDYSWNKRKSILLLPIKAFFGLLSCDLTFSWFGSFHAFFAVLFSKIPRKKSIVIIGGYEVAKIQEIGYGLLVYPIIPHMVRFVLKNADRVLLVDDSLKENIIKNTGVSGTYIKTIPTGYDEQIWKPSRKKKEDLVITVASVASENRMRVKGVETFVRVAERLPTVKFTLIGSCNSKCMNYLKSIAPANVELAGFIPNRELPQWYSKAKVYCQLSKYEGLPNSLCEAMLCECVPVVTKVGGMPKAVGDTGFYVPYGDMEATVVAITKALNCDEATEARERIKTMFPLRRREEELVQEIEGLLKASEETNETILY
ncbi:glycosyltransferase family 4 protein [Chloroflexota bacterium]